MIISCSLSPNTEREDIIASLKILTAPWTWFETSALSQVAKWFRQRYPNHVGCAYNSGRSALFEILKAFGIGQGDEVILQAFTCVAVPNAVIWTKATPIYVDIDERYNLNPRLMVERITKKTRAIIIQHTFGLTAAMKDILEIAHKHHLIIIEDCAHSLEGQYRGAPVGGLADAAIFSFGRDKIVSSVSGGYGIIHRKHVKAISLLQQSYARLKKPGVWWVFQQLFHPVAFSLILPLYQSGIGKLLLVFWQMLGFLSKPIDPIEYQSQRPAQYPKLYANALAQLLLVQLKKLHLYTQIRRSVANIYHDALGDNISVSDIKSATWLRYPVRVPNPLAVMEQAKRYGVLLGGWYQHVIDPNQVDLSACGYKSGMCPMAEETSRHIVNLPTRISPRQAQKVLTAIRL